MIKRLLVIGVLVLLLPGCGSSGSSEEEAASEPLPTLVIEVGPTVLPEEEGTPEPGSPRESDVVPGNGLPPTYTPSAHEFVSGAPTSAAAPGVVVGSTGGGRSHVVEKGETLGTIAIAYGVDLADLIKANQREIKDIDLIYPGQVLRIP